MLSFWRRLLSQRTCAEKQTGSPESCTYLHGMQWLWSTAHSCKTYSGYGRLHIFALRTVVMDDKSKFRYIFDLLLSYQNENEFPVKNKMNKHT